MSALLPHELKSAPLVLSTWILPINLSLPAIVDVAVQPAELDLPPERASADDEPETPEEAAAVAEALANPQGPLDTDELRNALGVGTEDRSYDNGLGRLAGTWSEQDLSGFEEATQCVESQPRRSATEPWS